MGNSGGTRREEMQGENERRGGGPLAPDKSGENKGGGGKTEGELSFDSESDRDDHVTANRREAQKFDRTYTTGSLQLPPHPGLFHPLHIAT